MGNLGVEVDHPPKICAGLGPATGKGRGGVVDQARRARAQDYPRDGVQARREGPAPGRGERLPRRHERGGDPAGALARPLTLSCGRNTGRLARNGV